MKWSIVILQIQHTDNWDPQGLAGSAADTVQTVLTGIAEVRYQGRADILGPGGDDEDMCVHCGQHVDPDEAFECSHCGGTVHAHCCDAESCLETQAELSTDDLEGDE